MSGLFDAVMGAAGHYLTPGSSDAARAMTPEEVRQYEMRMAPLMTQAVGLSNLNAMRNLFGGPFAPRRPTMTLAEWDEARARFPNPPLPAFPYNKRLRG